MKNLAVTFVLVLTLFFPKLLNGQIIIGKPSLGFTQACASASFNQYNVTFTFSPDSSLLPTNQFTLELSDADGDFTNSEVIYTSAENEFTSSPATITFSFPETIAGEGYKIRVKSSNPVATSTSSNSFAAYFKIQDTPFTINNLEETALFCTGGSYLLTIDNPGSDTNDSPLQYPSLTFNWFKATSDTTSEYVSTGLTLEVTEPGIYYAETDYGSCTSNSHSNRVEVIESSSAADAEITSSLGNPFCSGDGETTLSTINASTYQWYKDGELIEEATNQEYLTDEPGTYSVDIDLGGCNTTASITLETLDFSSSINVEEDFTINSGETIEVIITTDADSPVFQWYLNDVLLSSETSNTLNVAQTGTYIVNVTETIGCEASQSFQFVVTDPFPSVENIPNVISPNNDGVNDTWVIPQKYVSGTNTEIKILTAQGQIVYQTNDYLNNWPETEINFTSINPVYYYIITNDSETKKGSITVIK